MRLQRPAWAACALVTVWTSTAAPQEATRAPAAVTDLRFRTRIDRLHRDELRRLDIVDRLRFTCQVENRTQCFVPTPTADGDINVDRSLMVHDDATLAAADFSLQRTLNQLASQVVTTVPGTTGLSIFKQFWDTQNAAPGVSGAGNPHCDDNGTTVNGFPNSCRVEGGEATGTDIQVTAKLNSYAPVALVNRLDLAHQGWRNCGEHRIIYAKQGGPGRNFIIFEAVLPNPKPGCRDGCVPVAEFWKSLSAIAAPADRASQLETFYYTGLPGFRPVVHVDHYSAAGVGSTYGSSGSGQIRTNQFMQGPWTLKEFKTVLDCGSLPCKFQLVPIMVKVNPHGDLWNEDVANSAGPLQARAAAFQSAVLGQIPSLASDDLTGITYAVDLTHDAAKAEAQGGSQDDFLQKFQAATGAVTTFRTNFALDSENHLDALGGLLTADKVVRRAVTQDCAGCHQPSAFGLASPGSIGAVHTPTGGTVTSWPASLGFVHVDESKNVSPALTTHFLPARKLFLLAQLNRTRCACRSCFRFPTTALNVRAQTVQERVDKLFVPRIAELEEKLRTETDPAHGAKLTADLGKLLAERDSQVTSELKRTGIEDVVVSLKPQPMKLNASRLAGGNLNRERLLRQKEVLEFLKREPPRQTVTGSFRVH